LTLRSPFVQALRSWVLATAVLASAVAGPAAFAKGSPEDLGTIALQSLPDEARQTHRLISTGGPFPYAKDGDVFGNRERQLPRQARGFYREYTVATPGDRDRGPRRIVCGGAPPTRPETCYYTADHYASFKRIAP
jgi:ribonuclease T1